MPKVAVDLSPHQAEQLLDQLVARLDSSAKVRLVEQLDRQTRRARWEPLVLKMRRRFAQRPLSALQIRRLCETVRQEHFEQRQRAAGRH